MNHNKHSYTSALLVVSSLLISNVSAFFSFYLWLTPQLVFYGSVIWIMLAALCVWILKKNQSLSKFLKILKINWFILPFLIFSGLSIFWSVYWEISLSRWLILFCTMITAGYIGLRYNIHEILKILSLFGILLLFISSLFVFFMPHVGVMNYYDIQGAWKGVYWHKNHMGIIATLINILFLINIVDSLQSKRKHLLIWGLLYFFSLLFVYQ